MTNSQETEFLSMLGGPCLFSMINIDQLFLDKLSMLPMSFGAFKCSCDILTNIIPGIGT